MLGTALALVTAGCALLSAQTELRLKRFAKLSSGPSINIGSLVPFDTDRDGLTELVYRTGGTMGDTTRWEIAEHRGGLVFEIVKSDTCFFPFPQGYQTGDFIPHVAGDVDRDGKPDLAGSVRYRDGDSMFNALAAFESPDSGSHPDTAEWVYVYRGAGSIMTYPSVTFADLDQDLRREVIMSMGNTMVFENVADNRESLVYSEPPSSTGEYAIADFDLDGAMEYGVCHTARTRVCECIGDNRYAEVAVMRTGYPDAYDIWVGDDVDQNGRPEFFTASNWTNNQYVLQMIEAVADSQYVYYYVTTDGLLPGISSLGGRSLCADLDGDGVQEVIWSCTSHIIVLKATGPHQFERVSRWTSDHSERPGEVWAAMCAAYDFNGNGYNELIVGGNSKTSFLEVEAIRVLHPNGNEALSPGDTCPVTWQVFQYPRCDSVSLFLRTDSAPSLDTIVTGLAPADTPYAWVVPEVRAESAWVVAVAYGPGWQSDESDTAFSIGVPGIDESGGSALPRRVFPTLGPAAELVRFEGRILDALGREVRFSTSDFGVRTSHLPPGVYFLKSERRCAACPQGRTPNVEVRTRKVLVVR